MKECYDDLNWADKWVMLKIKTYGLNDSNEIVGSRLKGVIRINPIYFEEIRDKKNNAELAKRRKKYIKISNNVISIIQNHLVEKLKKGIKSITYEGSAFVDDINQYLDIVQPAFNAKGYTFIVGKDNKTFTIGIPEFNDSIE